MEVGGLVQDGFTVVFGVPRIGLGLGWVGLAWFRVGLGLALGLGSFGSV